MYVRFERKSVESNTHTSVWNDTMIPNNFGRTGRISEGSAIKYHVMLAPGHVGCFHVRFGITRFFFQTTFA